MRSEFRPIIYTYHLGQYLQFLEEVFEAGVELSDTGQSYFTYGEISFEIRELPKKRAKLLSNFTIIIQSFKDLEALASRLEFYYYRHKIKANSKIEKVDESSYQIIAIDPDGRELMINFAKMVSDFQPVNLSNIYS